MQQHQQTSFIYWINSVATWRKDSVLRAEESNADISVNHETMNAFTERFRFCDHVDVELNVMSTRYVGYKMALEEETEIT